MKQLYRLLFVAFALLSATANVAAQPSQKQQARKLVRKGNREYRANKRTDAAVTYLKAVQTDSTYAPALYNYALAQIPEQWQQTDQKNRGDIIRTLAKAADMEQNPMRKAQAMHNVGVLYQGAGEWGMAIQAYKEALRNNPNDDESRYNLAVCKKQQKDQPQDQQGQDQDQNGQQEKQQQDQQQDQQQQQQQQDQQQEQQQEPPMSKENAEQLLQAAMQQEKKTQDRLKDAQKQPQRRRLEKNW